MFFLWGTDKPVELRAMFLRRSTSNQNWTNPLPEGLAGTAWEPSKLPNYGSITPPSNTVVSLTTPTTLSLSLSLTPQEG
jgi:hypothetical protein